MRTKHPWSLRSGLVWIFHRNRGYCRCIHKEIYYMKLPHCLWGLRSPKICRQQTGGPGEPIVWVPVWVWTGRQEKTRVPGRRQSGRQTENSLLFHLLVPFRPLPGWMRPTHIHGVGFPGGAVGLFFFFTIIAFTAHARDTGDEGLIPGLGKIPWSRKWQLTPVFLPGEFQRQRSLVGYSPWDRKESGTTEHSHTHAGEGNLLFLVYWFKC